MSRDNTILIIRVKFVKRHLWIVLHIQAHELFGDPEFVKWRLWKESIYRLQYTSSRSTALRIAKKMKEHINYVEHGILEFHSKVTLTDCTLKKGCLVFNKPQPEPKINNDNSNEYDWIQIIT